MVLAARLSRCSTSFNLPGLVLAVLCRDMRVRRAKIENMTLNTTPFSNDDFRSYSVNIQTSLIPSMLSYLQLKWANKKNYIVDQVREIDLHMCRKL